MLEDEVCKVSLSEDVDPQTVAELALSVIQLNIEEDGLRFSYSLSRESTEVPASFVSDAIRKVLDINGLTGDRRSDMADALGKALRIVFIRVRRGSVLCSRE